MNTLGKLLTYLDYLTLFIISLGFHMLRFQVYILEYYCAVVFKDLSYLSNLTFLTSRYYFDCISNLDMHFMKHWQTVWFAVLPFPVLELHDGRIY